MTQRQHREVTEKQDAKLIEKIIARTAQALRAAGEKDAESKARKMVQPCKAYYFSSYNLELK